MDNRTEIGLLIRAPLGAFRFELDVPTQLDRLSMRDVEFILGANLMPLLVTGCALSEIRCLKAAFYAILTNLRKLLGLWHVIQFWGPPPDGFSHC